MNIHNLMTRKKSFLAVFICMAMLGVIFLNSFYWPHEGIGERKIVAGVIAILLAVVVPVMLISIDFFYMYVQRIFESLNKVIICIKNNKKKAGKFCIFILSVIAISYIVTNIISECIWKTGFNIHLLYMLLTIAMIAIGLKLLWMRNAFKPENIFVLIVVTLGIFSIGVTPDWTGVSWDDEIHYERALKLSNALNGIMYKADEMNIEEYIAKIVDHVGYERSSHIQNKERLDTSYEAKELVSHEFIDYGVTTISSIPSAIGIVFGRGLNLSYTGVFNMGRLFNLLIYVIPFFFAIRRVRYGKVLISCIGLIPTTVFMAASYSYDSWVTAFTVLGYSYFIAELQEETPLTYKNMAIMVGALIIGCMPKAIYFPMLFPLLFLTVKKFKNEKQRMHYYIIVIGAAVFLVGTFLLPILIGGAGTGDIRGGTEVNATEQIKFILNNPWEYTKTLYQFMLSYLSIGSCGVMLQKLCYVGDGWFYGVICIILAVVAFLDTEDSDDNHILVKSAILICNASAIILSATALYIDFTAVGSSTIAGMQGRYLIPTILPALYSLGWSGTKHRINRNAFTCVPMLMIAATFIYNMYMFCIRYY